MGILKFFLCIICFLLFRKKKKKTEGTCLCFAKLAERETFIKFNKNGHG